MQRHLIYHKTEQDEKQELNNEFLFLLTLNFIFVTLTLLIALYFIFMEG